MLVVPAILLVSAVVTVGVTSTPALAASSLGLDKDASVTNASPGQGFTYTLVPRCSGLTESCINAVVTDVIPIDIEVTSFPASDAEKTVTFDPGTRTLTIAFKIPLTLPSPPGSVGLPAGSSRSLELGVRVPDDSTALDGAVIVNTATITADNAPSTQASAPVTVSVPRVVRPAANKTWTDGSAVAGSGVPSTITLSVRNASSSTAQVTQLAIDDVTPEVFDRFDVTGIGPVTFPAGVDRVTVLACTQPLSACTQDSDFVTGTPQTGPAITLPAGIAAGSVTGLKFVFTSVAGTPLPIGPTGATVAVSTVLRATLRSTGGRDRVVDRPHDLDRGRRDGCGCAAGGRHPTPAPLPS